MKTIVAPTNGATATTAKPAEATNVNGSTKPAETPTANTNGKEEVKPTPEKADGLLPAVIEKPAGQPIAKRLEKFAELQRLHERREQVTEALEDLEDFHIGTTGGASIILQDSRGTKKAINHPIVVADMVASAKSKLVQELENIDGQFLV